MSDALATLGLAMLLGWLALPLLAYVASHRAEEPASRQRALTIALALGALLLLVPWLRIWTHHATALCFSKQTITAALAFAPSHFILERAAAPSLWLLFGLAGTALIAIGTARTLAQAVRLRRLLRRSTPAPRAISDAASQLANALGVPAPEVRVSSETSVPFVAGVRPHAIVLPRALLSVLDAARVELVLRHELTHIRRSDLQLAWVVAAARIPFLLHPVARWLAEEIALAREQAVDALVASEDPGAYARLLVDVAAHAEHGICPAPVAMAISALERRVLRLIGPSDARRTRVAPVVVVAGLLSGLAMIAPLRAESSPDRRAELIRCEDAQSTQSAPAVEPAVPEQDCTALENACEQESCGCTEGQ